MGVRGLLKLLGDVTHDTALSRFRGCTVAVDGYIWLHRGTYTCAADLALGRANTAYVRYCMRMVRTLQSLGIRPLIVLDGANLPSKEVTDSARAQRRLENLMRARQMQAAGNRSEADRLFAKCVDITPEMAFEFIKELRKSNVDFIVAPYEADAQLTYLVNSGLADIAISEDSDLLVFGCRKVLYKYNERTCTGDLVCQDDISKIPTFKSYDLNMFQEMCIFSGCDYLPNPPGIGLSKAQCLLKYRNAEQIITRWESGFDPKAPKIPSGYSRGYRLALLTFKFQRVYDPNLKTLVHLNPLPKGVILNQEVDEIVGKNMDPIIARGVAEGYLNPNTKLPYDTIIPDYLKKYVSKAEFLLSHNVLLESKSFIGKQTSIMNFISTKHTNGVQSELLLPNKDSCKDDVLVDSAQDSEKVSTSNEEVEIYESPKCEIMADTRISDWRRWIIGDFSSVNQQQQQQHKKESHSAILAAEGNTEYPLLANSSPADDFFNTNNDDVADLEVSDKVEKENEEVLEIFRQKQLLKTATIKATATTSSFFMSSSRQTKGNNSSMSTSRASLAFSEVKVQERLESAKIPSLQSGSGSNKKDDEITRMNFKRGEQATHILNAFRYTEEAQLTDSISKNTLRSLDTNRKQDRIDLLASSQGSAIGDVHETPTLDGDIARVVDKENIHGEVTRKKVPEFIEIDMMKGGRRLRNTNAMIAEYSSRSIDNHWRGHSLGRFAFQDSTKELENVQRQIHTQVQEEQQPKSQPIVEGSRKRTRVPCRVASDPGRVLVAATPQGAVRVDKSRVITGDSSDMSGDDCEGGGCSKRVSTIRRQLREQFEFKPQDGGDRLELLRESQAGDVDVESSSSDGGSSDGEL